MSADLLRMTARQLLEHYRNKTLSPVEVTEAMLDQIEARDEHCNAWCLLDQDTTLEYARASEERWQRSEPRGQLDGVPVAVKDVFLTPMWPTRKGSKTVDPDTTLNKEAPAVSALTRNGYVPLGKTTTPEFGWKGVTDSPLHGATNNPWNPEKTAGGSSGGSGAAVALGQGPLALGTDAGGSIRIPAAFCGLVGLKPTFGEVPHWPVSPFGTLAHAGPMSWTVEDCALMMNVLTEPDERDCQALPRRGEDYLNHLDAGIEGLKIAYSPTLGYADVDAEVEAVVEEAVNKLEELGATVTRKDPGFTDPLAAFSHLFYGGAAHAVRDMSERKRELMDPNLIQVADKAARRTMLDYLAANEERMGLAERMARFHTRFDLLVTPAVPITAFDTGREVPRDWPSTRWPTWTPFSYPFNMTGQPALTVPCGFSSEGLPIGLQIVGARFQDKTVLQAGHAYQQAAPLTDQRPPLFSQ